MNGLTSIIAGLLATIIVGITPSLNAQDLEEILEGHYEVMNMDALLKVKSVKTEGKMIMMGGQMEMGLTQMQMRPKKSRMEMDFQGNAFISVFDGEGGWMINPMAGPEPQELPEDQLEQMKQNAYIEGILYNYEEKGYKVELDGEDDVEGTPTYKLKVIPTEGTAETIFMHLDQDSYIIIKVDAIINVPGQGEVEAETFLSNYKEIDGIPFAHSVETRASGQVFSEFIFETITLNPELDESLFESEQ
ncbi:MAG: outer membrane lipoprotein-sorting protein [Bacteroidota bacterium]